MAERIAFHELVSRASQGALSPQDIQTYFKLDAANTKPFEPRFRIDNGTVDVAGFEQTAATAGNALALEAAAKAAPQRAARAPAPNGTYVAEGDSWFRLPPIIYPPTMIDILSATIPIDNLAHWGDTLAGMIAAGQYLPHLRTGKLKVLMFSAGGNDLLGETLEQNLKLYDVAHQQAGDAPWYLTEAFHSNLDAVLRKLTALAEQVRSLSPRTLLVLHGYDYARPQQNGPYVGIHFQRRGLQPMDHPALCQAIVKVMVDLFNRRLAALAAHSPVVRYVDLRGTVGPDDFYDGELHPNAAAAARLAQRLGKVVLPAPADASAAVA